MGIAEEEASTSRREKIEGRIEIATTIYKSRSKGEKELQRIMRLISFSEDGKSQWMEVRRSGIKLWCHQWGAV